MSLRNRGKIKDKNVGFRSQKKKELKSSSSDYPTLYFALKQVLQVKAYR